MRSASVGVEDAPGEHQLLGPRRADQAGQQPRVPMSHADRPMRMNAALNLADSRRQADVGAEHQGEPAAGGRAVDGGDDRLRQRAQVRDQRGDVLLHGEPGLRAARGPRCRGALP